MRLFSTVQFPGDLGKHSDPLGQECLGRVFTVKQVGVGGVYVNSVECPACKRQLAAAEDRLLPVQSMTTWHMKKTGEDQYHVNGGDQFTRIEEDVDVHRGMPLHSQTLGNRGRSCGIESYRRLKANFLPVQRPQNLANLCGRQSLAS
jgi:hypothetical protein